VGYAMAQVVRCWLLACHHAGLLPVASQSVVDKMALDWDFLCPILIHFSVTNFV